ncbi:hypothetical protein HYH02_012141 [Chlamydomonas schloesseri]|uniref:NB-ARC domain-containing protein n=1 Tax=Chlamydomonas schloesseri TaxID=2026947 RepID=A0A835TBG8_9CHLO|nr:hypothetical protein HYH02_012141 [Chlamydomonas schloesseri]|eukprot:KAG2434945.1 hypothetical protein HYH02_012141 [Chlamydomonas schloesseri]
MLQDVSKWFDTLPCDLAQHALALAHDEGCVLASVWSLQYLATKGLPPEAAARLIAYRGAVASVTTVIHVPAAATGATSPSGVAVAAAAAAPSTTQCGALATANLIAAAATPVRLGAKADEVYLDLDLVAEVPASDDDGELLQPTAAAAGESGKGKKLKALATEGLAVMRVVLERVGPALPFGGAEAANLILQVLDAVEGAVANAAKLRQLADRALTVMDVLRAYAEQLRELQRQHQRSERGNSCRKIVSRFSDHLRGILAYAEYAGRNCLVRLLTSSGDAERYREYVEELRHLSEDLRTLLAMDSNARLQAVQAGMAASLAALAEQRVAYQDPSAEARVLVAQLGGIDAVLADADKLGWVMQKMDVSARITIDVVSSLLRSHLDRGPQRHIQQPELRLFWAHHFGDLTEVPWFVFWECFPSLLASLPGSPFDAADVAEMGQLLGDQAAQAAFQRAVGRGNADTVSVWELRLSFRADDMLVSQVARLLGSRSGSGLSGTDESGGGGDGSSSRAGRGGGGAAVSAASGDRAPHNSSISSCGSGGGSVLLLAEGGMGKSCLAADVGWRLLRSGAAPGGVLWVDLREADSSDEVEARFCAVVGLQREPAANNVPLVVTAFRRMAADGLQQKENAESAAAVAAGGATATMTAAVDMVAGRGPPGDAAGSTRTVAAPAATAATTPSSEAAAAAAAATANADVAMRLLVVVDNAEDALARQEAAQSLRRVVAEDLSEAEVAQVAAVCQCVPLVLRVVADALSSGRLTLQLAVLPTAFDEELAAAVLGLAGPSQAYALLATLFRHSVLQRAAGSGGQARYVMHMLVRREAERLEEEAHVAASGRFVRHVLCRLREWGDMYAQGREWRLALTAGRDLAAADVGAAAEQLPRVPDPAAAAELLTPSLVGLLAALGALTCFKDPLTALCERLAAAEALESAAAVAEGAAGSNGAKTAVGEAAAATATAAALYALSCARLEGGSHGPAEEAASGALRRQQSALGPEDPRTLASRDQLAACLHAQGLFAAAESACRQVFELRRRVLGIVHPDVLASMSQQAACLRALGRHTEAAPLFRRALELRRAVLGPEHPHTLASMTSLAGFLRNCRQFAEAEPLYCEALALRERVLGADHPDTDGSVNALANCLRSLGRHAEAEPRYRAVRAWREQWLGPEHPETLTVLNNLASCLHKLRRYEEAECLFHQVLEARRRVLKPKPPQTMHPHTIFLLSNLASCIHDAGRPEEAEPLLREALALRMACENVGPTHADTATCRALLAACLRDLQRNTEAEELELQAAALGKAF